MALGVLFIMFVIISILSLVSIALMFMVKDRKVNNIAFSITVILGLVIGFMNVTALPSNETTEKITVGAVGTMALVAVICKLMKKNVLARILAAASVILGIFLLFW
ncbi:hypothetical protein QPK24_10695 [Paenibacillus polygoni]|uniref:Uncharacterized protein n=1 Tax=Paenibacillus polygoni TaxID=3050112 RepID=A0ABY8X6D2_9BACL|nr:hypothetical protein [Paenibacillus polygoni]WIV21097.1 hypothetical protein QPK24_10695 [Paenibacillus polygoni]